MPQLLIVAACTYALVALYAFVVADRLIFQPPRSSYSKGSPAFAHINVTATDSVAVLYLPLPDAPYTILYSHGNAEDLGHVRPLLEDLRGLGFAVLGYDYRGYGTSGPGWATSRRAIQDAEAVYQYAVRELAIAPERMILYGTSVGSGPAVELAARHQPAGLILQSAFTSTFRVITRVPLFPFDRFRNLARLLAVECPLFVVHGTRDHVVSWSHGKLLFTVAAEPKQSLWVEDAGHNDVLLVAGQRYVHALTEFVNLIEQHRLSR